MYPTAPDRRPTKTPTARAALLLAGLLTAGAAAAPASADAPSGAQKDTTYYRSVVTAVEPAIEGLQVTVQGNGESITLVNDTGKEIVVLGYSGEPYLRFGAHGVEVNRTSLSARINAGETPAAGSTRPAITWELVQNQARYTWRDLRVRWSTQERPPIVVQNEHAAHRVFDWALPLIANGEQVLVRGAVDWTGTPRFTAGQWASVGVLLVILAGFGVALWRTSRDGRGGGRIRARLGRSRDPFADFRYPPPNPRPTDRPAADRPATGPADRPGTGPADPPVIGAAERPGGRRRA